jgi:hypothetical protein
VFCGDEHQLPKLSRHNHQDNVSHYYQLGFAASQAIMQAQTTVSVLQCRKANFADADVSPLLLA